MGAERQRHQQLRCRPAQTNRRHDNHRQQGRNRAVDTDQRGQAGDQQQHHHHQTGAAFSGAGNQELTGPRGDTGGLKPGADHEKRRNEYDGGVAETREGLAEREHARGVERERRAEGDDHDRNTVPDKQHDDAEDDSEGYRYVAHAVRASSLAAAGGRDGWLDECGWSRRCERHRVARRVRARTPSEPWGDRGRRDRRAGSKVGLTQHHAAPGRGHAVAIPARVRTDHVISHSAESGPKHAVRNSGGNPPECAARGNRTNARRRGLRRPTAPRWE